MDRWVFMAMRHRRRDRTPQATSRAHRRYHSGGRHAGSIQPRAHQHVAETVAARPRKCVVSLAAEEPLRMVVRIRPKLVLCQPRERRERGPANLNCVIGRGATCLFLVALRQPLGDQRLSERRSITGAAGPHRVMQLVREHGAQLGIERALLMSVTSGIDRDRDPPWSVGIAVAIPVRD